MIAKGASRSGPRQLAVYLMRVERYETGEPVELLELKSPWAGTLNDGSDRPRIASRLIETFRDWQTLTEGTKQGRDGLYHAEISPEARYAATMTPEQWKRAADMLGEELGLQDQERAVVLHGGTDGRKHLHIVWARTDLDAMKLISDSLNYVAHERASKRMELEFGQEFVPGKHAKRDRELQPEFPREEVSQDEDQRQKRTGLKVADRKAEIAGLHAAADNAQSFKAALEEAGYLLAKGERGYVVVDELGGHSVLSRNIGLKKKELEAYMAAVDLNKLPSIEEAKASQKSVREIKKAERQEAAAKQAEKPAPEAPTQPEKAPESAPGKAEPPPIDLTLYAPKPKQAVSKFLPPDTAPGQGVEQSKFVAPAAPASEVPVVQPPAASAAEALERSPAAGESSEVIEIRKAVALRQAEDAEKWADYDALQLRQLNYDLTVLYNGKMGDYDRLQEAELKALTGKHAERRTGIMGVIDAIQSKLNPTAAAEKAAERQKEFIAFVYRQQQERRDYVDLIRQSKEMEIEGVKERQALQRDRREHANAEETERYIQEHEDAKRIAEELKAHQIHEELEHNDSLREGPPPPAKGK